MIRINAIPNSVAAKSYYDAADYHLEGQEEPAFWHGKGAEMLGLTGPITKEAFELLCENKNPQTGKQLTAKHIENRRVGYDFTFSPSKSVSVLYALGADPRLADEFRGAVAETMAEVEREMATRVRKSGQDTDRRTGNMIWADFLHHTSRPIEGIPDPQLHIHAVVFNATYDHEEGQWKAGQFGGIKKDAPYFQASFRARLADRLQKLGYEIKRGKDDFEIVGVPDRVIKEFSRRTNLIEKTAEKLGVTRPETKAKLGATTREAKTDGLTWDDLLRLWKNRLRPGELERIEGAVKGADHLRGVTKMVDRSRESVDWALRHLLERSSVVSQRDVVTQALRHGLGNVTPEGILKEIGSRKDLIRRVMDGQEMVTTKEVLAEEQMVLDWAKRGRDRWRPLGGASQQKGSPSAQPTPLELSPTQASAVKHALTSRDRLILIRGAAGTGKTTLTKALLAGVDVPYVVLAPSAEASRGVLRREKVDPNADTLAKFLIDEEMQARVKNGLIVLDEASLAGAHDIARLVKAADSLGARILMLGDRRQHKSVARGDVLAMLEDKAGIPVAEVGEIRRQSGEYKKIAELLRDGNMPEAFNRLDKLGWIKEGGIVDDYLDAVKDGKSSLIVVPTHAEGERLTAELRDRLKAGGLWVKGKEIPVLQGEEKRFQRLENLQMTEAERTDAPTLRQNLGAVAQFVRHGSVKAGERVIITAENAEQLAKEGSRFIAYRPRELGLAAGDTIRITANGQDVTGKHRLNSGSVYQVSGFTDNGIRLSNGWVIGKDFAHLSHGYTSTSQGGQGKTVDRMFLWMPEATFPAVRMDTAYTSGTRGRERLTVYTDDREGLLEAVSRQDTRMLASDLVKQPRQHLARKKKRALQFMRDVADKFRPKEPEREKPRGRELDK